MKAASIQKILFKPSFLRPVFKSGLYYRAAFIGASTVLNFKTTWSEFYPLPRVGPKQLCASAHLGCTREAGTS